MTRAQMQIEIEFLAQRLSKTAPGCRCYLFGSARTNLRTAADVDLLVVCESDDEADAIRHLASACELYPPLHISIYTKEEEMEGDFVNKQGCVRIA
jgi:predicted nucleotidyltransferase